MGTCLSKKKGSSTSSPIAGAKSVCTAPDTSGNGVNVTLSNSEPSLKNKKTVQEKQQDPEVVKTEEGQVKKEIFIIKHRKSHDDRERNSKIQSCTVQQNVPAQPADGVATSEEASTETESFGNKIAPSTPSIGVVGVRTSSCTKEEVDAILIQCGRLSRSSSGKAACSSGGRKYSGSKRSYDFDHCDNDTISAEDDHKRTNGSDNSEEYDGVAAEKHHHHQHRQRHRQSPRRSSSSQGRRRTPSRERDQQNQRSSSRERRVSRSPGRRTSETTTSNANASNNNSVSRPGKMVSVPATVSSLVMDKSNNGGGGEIVKKITVKRNAGDSGMVGSRSAASPRSRSPARANGNVANVKVLNENQQQQPSLSRNNSSRKAEQSPYRRNPLSEVDPNSLAYPQSNTNNGSSKVQNKSKKDIEAEANQKPNIDMNDNSRNRTSGRVASEKGLSVNCKTKEQQEEEIKVLSSVPDNAVVKAMVPSGVDNLKPQTLTRSRSSRRSRDLDLNPEDQLNLTQSYTSLLLEDIHNFHQKNTQPSVSLPACLTKACSILEAVADLNSTNSSNFCEDRRSPPTCQSIKNEYNVFPLGANHYGKKVPDNTKDPFVESEVVVNDDVMEPSLHKYVTVKRGGALGGIDMEDQESSGSNSFTVSSGQQHWGISSSSSSWEPNSADSTDCWTSRLNTREEGSDVGEARKKKTLNNSKRRECDHQHSSGIGRGKLGGSNKGSHSLPIVTAAAST